MAKTKEGQFNSSVVVVVVVKAVSNNVPVVHGHGSVGRERVHGPVHSETFAERSHHIDEL